MIPVRFAPSIRAKMILMQAGTLALAVAVIAFVVRGLVFERIIQNKLTTVDVLTTSLVHDVKYSFDVHEREEVSEIIAKYMTYYRIIRRISYYDVNLVNVADSDRNRVGQWTSDAEVVAAVSRATPTLKVTRRDSASLGIRSTTPMLRGSRVVGAFDLEVSIEDIELLLSSIDRRIATILAVTLLLSSVLLYVLLRGSVLVRLSRLTAVTQRIAGGNYDVRVDDDRSDELGELARAFNRMTSDLRRSAAEIAQYNEHLQEMVRDATAQLQKAYEDLKSAQSQLVLNEKMASLGVLMAGVAHEINTPVGSILNVSRNLERRVAALPGTLAAFREDAVGDAAGVVACLEAVIRSARAARRAPSHREMPAIEDVLRELELDDPLGKGSVLAKLNFTDPAEIRRHAASLRIPSVFALAEAFGSIAQAAKISETSSQKITEIVRALKYYAYSRESRADAIQLNESIQTALVLLRNHFGSEIAVTTELDAGLPPVRCTSEIHQVWTNLLTNACDAVRGNGPDRRPEISVRTGRADANAVVEIRDNGPGIPRDIIDKVFDPFFTTKDIGKGTGLGLSIVSGIVKKHQGEIRLASRPGETVFEIVLPIDGPKAECAEPGAPARPVTTIVASAPVPAANDGVS